MTTRTRRLAALGLVVVILASATAARAQKGDEAPPGGPGAEVGPFARAGNAIINVRRVDYVEIQRLENGDSMLSVYLIGRSGSVARVRGRDSAGLLRAMGLPPMEPAGPAP